MGYPVHAQTPSRPDVAYSAVSAAVLAILVGGACALLVVMGGLALAEDDQLDPIGVVVLASAGVLAAMLVVGAVLLLARKPSGRGTLAAAAALSFAGVSYVLVRSSEIAEDPGVTWSPAATDLGLLTVIGVGALVVVTAILALVLLPATGRWCTREEPRRGGFR